MPLCQILVLVHTVYCSGADWLKSTGLSVRKKQIKLSGDLREMVYKAASCSYMLKISKNTLFLGHPVVCIVCSGIFILILAENQQSEWGRFGAQ